MFPMKTGFSDPTLRVGDPTSDIKSLTASALHEIAKRAIKDIGLLVFHQMAAQVYYRQDEGIPINTDDNGHFVVYSPAEEKEIRGYLTDIVMKFHILSNDGLAAKLTPLIDYMYKNEPIPADKMSDPFLNAVISGKSTFSKTTGNIRDKISDFSHVMVNEQSIISSYGDGTDDVDVAIFEDGHVQCACDFCEGFFGNIPEKGDDLNPLQKIMATQYGL